VSALTVLKFITTHPLSRGKEIEAVIRFAKWQIGSRLVGGDVVHGWVNGSKFLVRAGETGLTGNVYTGLHEFADMGFLLHVLRKEDLFVDVGANVGSYSILAGGAVGARVCAFEPVLSTYNRLVQNVRLNRLEDRVRCQNAAVGRESGTVRFTSDLDTVNHAIGDGESHINTVDVEVTTLDDALRGENPYLVKIDVEGYEAAVLQGAVEMLGKKGLQSLIMELNGSGNRYNFEESRILESMLDLGFQRYSYDPLSRSLMNLGYDNLPSANTLFIRDKPEVLDRIANAPLVTVLGKRF
jgi:FkbM family methyltransferase